MAEPTPQAGLAAYAAQTRFPSEFAVQGYGGVMQMMNVDVLEVGKTYIVNKGDGTGDQTLVLTSIQKAPLVLMFGAVEVNNQDHVISEAKAQVVPVPAPVAPPSGVIDGSGDSGVSAVESSVVAPKKEEAAQEDDSKGQASGAYTPPEFPIGGKLGKMDACDCENAKLDLRQELRTGIVTELVQKHINKTAPLSYTSIGAGGLLQDYLTLSDILGKGYKNVSVQLVDSSYGDAKELDSQVAALQGTPQKQFLGMLNGARRFVADAAPIDRETDSILKNHFGQVPGPSKGLAKLAVQVALNESYKARIEEFQTLLQQSFQDARIVITTHSSADGVTAAQQDSRFLTQIVVSVDTPGIEKDKGANAFLKHAQQNSTKQIMKTLNKSIQDWKPTED